MTRSSGGDKRSSWLTFQRRLFVVRRLVRGPANTATIIAEARAAFDNEAYPPDADAALRHDLAKLRGEFGCDIRFEHDRRYHLKSPGRLAILDLPDEELEALAFLLSTFDETSLPNAEAVGSLLNRVLGLIPVTRRSQISRAAHGPRLDQPLSLAKAEEELLIALRRAIGRRQIQFSYVSPYSGGRIIVHRVAPYDLFFRDGHTYLEAVCLEAELNELCNTYVLYRLDRIVTQTLAPLPTQLPQGRTPRRAFVLHYTLSPVVARQRDIALWFPESEVMFEPDGSAAIMARVTDLWQARQILLRYREHCHVLGPPELVAMMRESIARMAALYTRAED